MIELTPKQSEAFRCATSGDYQVIIYGGAIRGGKTYCLLTTFIYLSLNYPNSRWVIIRNNLPSLKKTTLPSFNSIIDRGVRDKILKWNGDTQVVTFKNKSEIMFMAESFDSDKDLDKFKGLEANGFGFEEINECQEATFYKAIERTGTWLNATTLPPMLVMATLNPAHNWVKKTFYEPYCNNSLPENWKYISAKITDNKYIPQEYIDNLKSLPPVNYARFVEGDWDIMDAIENPFLDNFRPQEHISEKEISFNPNLPLYVSVDFNINPFCALMFQIIPKQYLEPEKIVILAEVSVNNGSIEKMCKAIYQVTDRNGIERQRIRITGDAMGNRGEISQRDNASNYMLMLREMKLSRTQFNIKANPKHSNSRTDCNNALNKLHIFVNPSLKGCINDFNTVACDAAGNIIKSNRKKLSQRADFLDCFRYFVNTYLKEKL